MFKDIDSLKFNIKLVGIGITAVGISIIMDRIFYDKTGISKKVLKTLGTMLVVDSVSDYICRKIDSDIDKLIAKEVDRVILQREADIIGMEG